MRHRREILDTYRRGDKLPDDELEFLRQTMQDIADAVSGFGDLFTLQYAYAQRVADDCRQFQQHRADRAKRDSDRAEFADAMNAISD